MTHGGYHPRSPRALPCKKIHPFHGAIILTHDPGASIRPANKAISREDAERHA